MKFTRVLMLLAAFCWLCLHLGLRWGAEVTERLSAAGF